jgi:peptidoglycan/LPS O-acetylase OafA/YrhL
MALLVIVSHSITLGGFGNEAILGNQSLGSLAVDGFFGISGFLICGSAMRHIERQGRRRGLVRYFWDRVLRIFPAYWLCLVVTAAFFGPIGWLAAHHTLSGYWSDPLGPVHYLTSNFTIRIGTLQIAGTPAHIPYPLTWDTSLWTLYWEFLCYIGIAILAALGLLFRRGVVAGIAVAVWCIEIGLFFHPLQRTSAEFSTRFAAIFLVGALMYLYRDRVPDSGVLALGLLVVACVGFAVGHPHSRDPDWLTGPALVYPVLWLGSHLPFQRIGATNDISYGVYIYAFPVGQLLAIAGVQRAGYVPYVLATIICTLPLAAASWWGLEKWALMARKWQPLNRQRVAAVS